MLLLLGQTLEQVPRTMLQSGFCSQIAQKRQGDFRGVGSSVSGTELFRYLAQHAVAKALGDDRVASRPWILDLAGDERTALDATVARGDQTAVRSADTV